MKTAPVFFFGFLILGIFSSCLKDEPFKRTYEGFIPQNFSDTWKTSTPYAEDMDNNLVDQAFRLVYKDSRFTMARSLIIVRNGKIVAEAYPHDAGDAERPANIQSMTKSFTSILTGIAIKQNLLESVDQSLYNIYPEHFEKAPEKKGITIKDALTMKTGINFDNGKDTKTLYQTEGNSVEFVLSRKQEYDPGTLFRYHDGAPHLISAAIQKQYGKTFSEFAKQFLFDPLEITNWQWEAAKDGNNFGAFSLFLKPRDLAKFGELLLQNGKWNGQQLIDSAWIAEVSRPLVNSSLSGAPYGYYFWIYPAYEAFAADGHGGQRIMVFPKKNLVIVYTAWGYTSGDFFDRFNDVADLIFKSCH